MTENDQAQDRVKILDAISDWLKLLGLIVLVAEAFPIAAILKTGQSDPYVGWGVGFLLVIVVGLFYDRYLQLRPRSNPSISQSGLEQEKGKATVRRSAEELYSKFRDDSAIAIVFPEPNQRVPYRFDVTGSCRSVPDGFELWIFTVSGAGRLARYWPQEAATVDGGVWHSKVWGLGGSPQQRKKFGAFLVGKNGQALVHYYKTAGKEAKEHGATKWSGIKELTDDIIECRTMEVVLEEAKA